MLGKDQGIKKAIEMIGTEHHAVTLADYGILSKVPWRILTNAAPGPGLLMAAALKCKKGFELL